MSLGNGYLSSNMLSAFPFADGQCIAWEHDRANDLQCALQKCFVDAGVYLNSHTVDESEWPSIHLSHAANGVISFMIGAFEDDVSLSVSSSRQPFPMINGNAPWGAFVISCSSEGINDLCSLLDELSVAPPALDRFSSSPGRDGDLWLKLCPKCVVLKPQGLTSIQVYDGQVSNNHLLENGPHFILQDAIKIRPGNNMQLQDPDDTDFAVEGRNGISLNAIPGAGLGRNPCTCQETPVGNNMLAGPDGHARLFNDTCYDLEPGPKYIDPDTGFETQDLKIHVKCTACCTCDMYAALVDRLSILAGSAAQAGSIRWAKASLNDYLRQYESAVRLFNERLSKPLLSDVTMSLSGMPIGANISPKLTTDKVKGRMSRCAFTAIIRNASYFEIVAVVRSLSGSNIIVESSASWSDEGGSPLSTTGDSAAAVLGSSFVIYPGRSLVINFVSQKTNMVNAVSTGGFAGYASVSLSYKTKQGDTRALGSLSKSVEV